MQRQPEGDTADTYSLHPRSRHAEMDHNVSFSYAAGAPAEIDADLTPLLDTIVTSRPMNRNRRIKIRQTILAQQIVGIGIDPLLLKRHGVENVKTNKFYKKSFYKRTKQKC